MLGGERNSEDAASKDSRVGFAPAGLFRCGLIDREVGELCRPSVAIPLARSALQILGMYRHRAGLAARPVRAVAP